MNAVVTGPSINYVDATRAHTFNGVPVPSVTQILRATGVSADFSQVAPFVLERKRQIGQAVHTATHYFDDGDINESSIAAEVVPYLDAWKRFRDERKFVPQLLETVVASRCYHFIGRLDRLGRADGSRLVLCDIKIGDPVAAAADLQTAGYETALREEHPELEHEAIERWSVQLCDDGRYRLKRYPYAGRTNRQDRAEFLVLAKAVNLRMQRNGGIPCWM